MARSLAPAQSSTASFTLPCVRAGLGCSLLVASRDLLHDACRAPHQLGIACLNVHHQPIMDGAEPRVDECGQKVERGLLCRAGPEPCGPGKSPQVRS